MENENPDKARIVHLLKHAYLAEIETMMNYLAAVNNLRGVKAEVVKGKLQEELEDEFNHAKRLGDRIRVLDGEVPPSADFRGGEIEQGQYNLSIKQKYDGLKDFIQSVMDAESEAIRLYKQIIHIAEESNDAGTSHIVSELLADEESHYKDFEMLKAGL